MIARICSLIGLIALLVLPTASSLAQTITAQWTRKINADWAPNGPSSRTWSKLFYDSTSQRIALYGGATGGGYKSDIWHYNITNDSWLAIELPTINCPGHHGFSGPDGRDGHSAEFDPINNMYWSVAGGGSKCTYLGEYLPIKTAATGTTITSIMDSTLDATTVDFYKDWTVTVGSKVAFVTAYDPVAKKLTLGASVAGLTAGSTYTIAVKTAGQTWYYSKDTRQWASLEGPHWGSIRPSPVASELPPRHTPGFAWSTHDNVMVLHGGGYGGDGSNDTWVLDPLTKHWTQKQPISGTGIPFKLMELTSNFVYDEANDVFVLFGGRCGGDSRCVPGKPTGETWAYKLSTNTWTKMTPPVSPVAREGSAMFYDAHINKVVLFGGATVDIYNVFPTAAQLLNDLWVYDYASNTWTQIATSVTPAGRWNHMMAYDPIAQKAVMYAGQGPGSSVSEVWTLQLMQQSGNTPPVASATVTPASGTTTTGFAFSGSGSTDLDGQITGYAWNFGDGASGSGVSVNHQFPAAGSYSVKLTVTDNTGATGVTTIPVTVTANSAAPSLSFKRSITGTIANGTVTQILVGGTAVPFTVAGSDFSATISTGVPGVVGVVIEFTGLGGGGSQQLSVSVP